MEVDLEVTRKKEIAFDLWKDALDLFSIRNQGRTVRVEVQDPGQRDYRVDVTGTVLQGVAVSDDGDEMRTASLFLGQNPVQHARYTVSGVKQVLILSNDKGFEQGIELLSGDDNRTRLIVVGADTVPGKAGTRPSRHPPGAGEEEPAIVPALSDSR